MKYLHCSHDFYECWMHSICKLGCSVLKVFSFPPTTWNENLCSHRESVWFYGWYSFQVEQSYRHQSFSHWLCFLCNLSVSEQETCQCCLRLVHSWIQGRFFTLLMSFIKSTNTSNGGNTASCSFLYFTARLVHFSCRPYGNLEIIGLIPDDESRFANSTSNFLSKTACPWECL